MVVVVDDFGAENDFDSTVPTSRPSSSTSMIARQSMAIHMLASVEICIFRTAFIVINHYVAIVEREKIERLIPSLIESINLFMVQFISKYGK